MNRRTILALTTTALLCTGVIFSSSHAPAQQKSLKDQLVGAWTLVSIDNTAQDGSKLQPFGANPKGTLIFDASGRYSQAQVRTGRTKFKSPNRLQATPDEAKAAMNDTLAQFGTWSIDEASKTILLRVEGSLIPNAEGTETKRINVTATADELKYSNPAPALGGRNESVYRRAK